MGIFDRFKKSDSKTEEPQVNPELQAIKETQEKIKKHSEGASKINEALAKIDIDYYIRLKNEPESKYGISVETLENYKKIIRAVNNFLEDDAISDVDTEEIDSAILELVEYFKNALEHGNESTATQDIRAIGEGVRFTRIPYDAATEDNLEQKKKQRLTKMNTVVTVALFQNYIDSTNITIEKINQKIDEWEEKKAAAYTAQQDLLNNDPLLQAKLTAVLNHEGKLTPEIQAFAIACDRAAASANNLSKYKLLCQKKEAHIATVEQCAEQVNMMMFGTTEMFGKVAIERMINLQENFRNDLVRSEGEIKDISKVSEDADAAFQTFLNNSIDEKTLYNAIKIRQEVKEEEAAERARQAAIIQKQAEDARKRLEEAERKQAEEQKLKDIEAETVKNKAIIEE